MALEGRDPMNIVYKENAPLSIEAALNLYRRSTEHAVRPGAFSAVYNIPRSASDTACVPPITR
jgi:hypothetical protein